MTFGRRANHQRRDVCAGGGTRKPRTLAGFVIQEDVILSRQSQFKKGA
jgi:hypothetical protein